jgi:hypothetical protein
MGAGFDGAFEELEHEAARAFDVGGVALEADPAFAGRWPGRRVRFEQLQVAGIVIEELLGEAGGFEVKGLDSHGRGGGDWGSGGLTVCMVGELMVGGGWASGVWRGRCASSASSGLGARRRWRRGRA